jgi:hypothetical protein
MKKLPIGIQTFSKLVDGDYLYIDKTRDIYNLISQGGQYYFLSRPRRFGKSLLISTLREIFSGNKELFKGLWIYDQIGWDSYPIIHLDFLGLKYRTPEELVETLEYMINRNAQSYGIRLRENGYDKRFIELIGEMAKIAKVVILVDEYDKPIIENIENREIAGENRKILKTFYEAVKVSDEYLQFVLITGVSKFSKVSIFSGLNNLDDITVDDRFSTILGYTHYELLHYFKDRLKGQSVEDIRRWYNGYSWDGKNFVYNPLSVLHFFNKGKFGNYWFATGTPGFLTKFIKNQKIDVQRIEDYETNELILDAFEIERINVFALLFQTGYLTIKEIKPISSTQSIYRLSYPNEEVKESFLEYLVADYTGKFADEVGYLVYRLQQSLAQADLDEFIGQLKSIFASVPYDIFIEDRESYYHTVIYLVLKLLGINVSVEIETNRGRIDCVVENERHVFLMEFKVGKAADAMSQIKERKYYERYLSTAKKIKLVGVGFNMDERNIGDLTVEDISPPTDQP